MDMTTEEATAILEMTPHMAIQHAIWELLERRDDRRGKDDPNGVLPWFESRIECLSEAQRQLEELREVKKALRVLKSALI